MPSGQECNSKSLERVTNLEDKEHLNKKFCSKSDLNAFIENLKVSRNLKLIGKEGLEYNSNLDVKLDNKVALKNEVPQLTTFKYRRLEKANLKYLGKNIERRRAKYMNIMNDSNDFYCNYGIENALSKQKNLAFSSNEKLSLFNNIDCKTSHGSFNCNQSNSIKCFNNFDRILQENGVMVGKSNFLDTEKSTNNVKNASKMSSADSYNKFLSLNTQNKNKFDLINTSKITNLNIKNTKKSDEFINTVQLNRSEIKNEKNYCFINQNSFSNSFKNLKNIECNEKAEIPNLNSILAEKSVQNAECHNKIHVTKFKDEIYVGLKNKDPINANIIAKKVIHRNEIKNTDNFIKIKPENKNYFYNEKNSNIKDYYKIDSENEQKIYKEHIQKDFFLKNNNNQQYQNYAKKLTKTENIIYKKKEDNCSKSNSNFEKQKKQQKGILQPTVRKSIDLDNYYDIESKEINLKKLNLEHNLYNKKDVFSYTNPAKPHRLKEFDYNSKKHLKYYNKVYDSKKDTQDLTEIIADDLKIYNFEKKLNSCCKTTSQDNSFNLDISVTETNHSNIPDRKTRRSLSYSICCDPKDFDNYPILVNTENLSYQSECNQKNFDEDTTLNNKKRKSSCYLDCYDSKGFDDYLISQICFPNKNYHEFGKISTSKKNYISENDQLKIEFLNSQKLSDEYISCKDLSHCHKINDFNKSEFIIGNTRKFGYKISKGLYDPTQKYQFLNSNHEDYCDFKREIVSKKEQFCEKQIIESVKNNENKFPKKISLEDFIKDSINQRKKSSITSKNMQMYNLERKCMASNNIYDNNIQENKKNCNYYNNYKSSINTQTEPRIPTDFSVSKKDLCNTKENQKLYCFGNSLRQDKTNKNKLEGFCNDFDENIVKRTKRGLEKVKSTGKYLNDHRKFTKINFRNSEFDSQCKKFKLPEKELNSDVNISILEINKIKSQYIQDKILEIDHFDFKLKNSQSIKDQSLSKLNKKISSIYSEHESKETFRDNDNILIGIKFDSQKIFRDNKDQLTDTRSTSLEMFHLTVNKIEKTENCKDILKEIYFEKLIKNDIKNIQNLNDTFNILENQISKKNFKGIITSPKIIKHKHDYIIDNIDSPKNFPRGQKYTKYHSNDMYICQKTLKQDQNKKVNNKDDLDYNQKNDLFKFQSPFSINSTIKNDHKDKNNNNKYKDSFKTKFMDKNDKNDSFENCNARTEITDFKNNNMLVKKPFSDFKNVIKYMNYKNEDIKTSIKNIKFNGTKNINNINQINQKYCSYTDQRKHLLHFQYKNSFKDYNEPKKISSFKYYSPDYFSSQYSKNNNNKLKEKKLINSNESNKFLCLNSKLKTDSSKSNLKKRGNFIPEKNYLEEKEELELSNAAEILLMLAKQK